MNTKLCLLTSMCLASLAHSADRSSCAPCLQQATESSLVTKHCAPCEGGVQTLSNEQEEHLMREVPRWALDRRTTHKLYRHFSFSSFKNAMNFINAVADVAEQEGHHPDITVFYNRVQLELHTHAINGLSENDFILAARIDVEEKKIMRSKGM